MPDDPRHPAASDLLEQLQAMLDVHVEDLAFAMQSDGRVVAQNKAATEFLGSRAHATDWLASHRFHDPETKAALPADHTPTRLLLGGQKSRVQMACLGADHAEHTLTFTHYPLAAPVPHLILASVWDASPAVAPEHSDRLHELGNILGIIQLATDQLAQSAKLADDLRKIADLRAALARGQKLLHSTDPQALGDSAAAPPLHLHTVLGEAVRTFERVLPQGMHLAHADFPEVLVDGLSYTDAEVAIIEMLTAMRMHLVRSGAAQAVLDVALSAANGTANLAVGYHAGADQPDIPPLDISALALPATHTLAEASGGTVALEAPATGVVSLVLELALSEQPMVLQPGARAAAPDALAGYLIDLHQIQSPYCDMLAAELTQLGALVRPFDTVAAWRGLVAASRLPDLVLCPSFRIGGTAVAELADAIKADGLPTRLLVLTGQVAAQSTSLHAAMVLRKPVASETLINAIRLRPPVGG